MTTFFIEDYTPFMFSETNMQTYLKYKFAYYSPTPTSKTNKSCLSKQPAIDPLFFPREQDSLFWCFFIMSKGDVAYEMLANKNALVARQFKIDYVSKIRENKPLMKTYKFDTITNLENNLVNDYKVNIKTIFSLCAIENINVVYVSGRAYVELRMNDTDTIYIIRNMDIKGNIKGKEGEKKYGYEVATPDRLHYIRDNLYKIDSINKPFKSISSYTLTDLTAIAGKLGLGLKKENDKSKTKTELYEDIVQYLTTNAMLIKWKDQ